MTTKTVTLPSAVAAHMPVVAATGRVIDCVTLIAAAKALDLDVPAALTNLLNAIDVVRHVPAPPNVSAVADELLTAAAAGKLTAEVAAEGIEQAALAASLTDRRNTVRAAVQQGAVRRFHTVLRDGAADDFLDQLRPRVAEAVAAIAQAKTVVDPGQSLQELLDTAGPAELGAYQQLKSAVHTLNRIGDFVKVFGLHGDWPVIGTPASAGSENPAINARALFMVDGNADTASIVLRETPPIDAAGVAASPWQRLPVHLATIAEATEKTRAVAESAWASVNSRDPGRINPFTIVEADK